jgi:fibronectin-binding autotransporter adhesin
MKPNRLNSLFRAASISTLAILFSQSVMAATGTWNVNNGGNWSAGGNWAGGTIANDANSTANFTFNITANRTVTLDSSRTLNALVFTDLTTASHDWILNNSNNAVLTLAGTFPRIEVTNRTATISAPIAGTLPLTKLGTGTLILSGANTFSGGISNGNGILQLNSNTAAGSGPISLVAGGTAGVSTRLNINGGVTIANAVNVGPTTNVPGPGSLQQSGTGQGRINGPITITGGPSAGGHFVGGGAVGNELVLGGAIDSTITNLSQRDGRVVYAGGGTGGSWNSLLVTNTAIVGANNGIPTGVSIILGGSGNAGLDLNGFNQTLAAVTVGNTGNGFSGTVNLGANTLTLNGNYISQSNVDQNVSHVINAIAGSGTLAMGAVDRTFTIPDTTAANDLVINNATIAGSGGGFIKAGAGTVALNNVTATAPVTIATGGLTIGNLSASTLTAGSLVLGAGTTVNLDVAAGGDLIVANSVSADSVTLALSQFGGVLPNGIYPLISYSGTSPGLANLTADTSAMGHATGTLIDTGTAIAYQVTGNSGISWDGTVSDEWSTLPTGNWKLTSNNAATDFITGDDVVFPSNPTAKDVFIAGNVSPSKVTFNNAAGTDYLMAGSGGITGTTGLTKLGAGKVTLDGLAAHSFVGPVTLTTGTLEINQQASGITATSGFSVASGTTLRLFSNNVDFTFNRTLTGTGTVAIDGNNSGIVGPRTLTFTGDSTGFSGLFNLLASGDLETNGSFRLNQIGQVSLGTASVRVNERTQLWVAGTPISNNLTITGYGYQEGSATAVHPFGPVIGANDASIEEPQNTYAGNGGLGAIRLNGGTILGGTITLDGDSKLMAYNATATISGNMSNTSASDDLVVGGANNGTTIILTGDNSGLDRIWINGGGTVGTSALQVGANDITGTLGAGDIILYTDASAASLRFHRSDGYNLAQNVIAAHNANPATLIRASVLVNSTGTGLNVGANTIDLSDGIAGGIIQVGNAVANSSMTIPAGAVIDTGRFNLGEAANVGGMVTQTGGTVNVINQLRVAHFGTNTSTYNLSGGTVTLTGASPNLTPSTSGAGGDGTTGDNNINALNPQVVLGGGVYIGIDGMGLFNHSGGTLTTNWMVLDNRGASGAGANMTDGIDRYNLSGSAQLNLRSAWGLIGRNDLSYEVLLGGGTIRVDNTGTGTGTGADLTVPLDAILTTANGTTTTLDTNGAGNGLSLTKNVVGSGTLALTGGGSVNVGTAGLQFVSANFASSGTPAKLVKIGAGTTDLSGSMTGFTGGVTVAAGRLNIPDSLNTAVTVESGATLAGEVALPSLTMNGGTLVFNPTTGSTLTATTLNLTGSNSLAISAAPGVGSFTALTYGSKTGDGTLTVANAADFRTAPVVSDNGSAVSVAFDAGKSLTWTGQESNSWNINADVNWIAGVTAEKFFSSDSVIFDDSSSFTTVDLIGNLAPASLVVNTDLNSYTFNASVNGRLTGGTGIAKSGTSTLILNGANEHHGMTSISGGAVSINTPAGLGSGLPGNAIALSNGGALTYAGTGTYDLGLARNVSVGAGGGVLAHSNGAAATMNLTGNLSGSGALNFQSNLAGAGTFNLIGSNSGFTGPITVSALAGGVSNLRIDNPTAVPNASLIDLQFPPNGANGAANQLSLPGGVNLPATTAIHMSSLISPANASVRSQITTSGEVAINGPIKLAGDSICQLNTGGGSVVTLNGQISEIFPGSFTESPIQAFSSVLFLRGTGSIVVNGQINLPSTGSTVAVTDGASVLLNSTGNEFKSASIAFGAIRLGATDAIPTTARLALGQAGNQVCTLDLNGFNQTVTNMEFLAPTGNLLTKGISNTHPTDPSTFTLNQVIAPAANFNGTISGRTNFVKQGAESFTLAAAASNFTGDVAVSTGTLVTSGLGAAAGGNGSLGAANVPGKTITVGAAGTLSFTSNNIFGNGVANSDLPTVVINGGTLVATRYNVLGNVTLNGGTLDQSATDAGGYQGYQFRGSVTVGGSAASTISTGNAKANHLGATTEFIVADATASAAADLVVSAPLANQSNDFGAAPGALVKSGPGTLSLTAANTHTGGTVVNAGTLHLADDARLLFVIGGASGVNNTLTGSGNAVLDGAFAINTTAAAALNSGTWLLENVSTLTGPYGATFQVVDPDGTPWSASGDVWSKSADGKTWSFDETTGTLTLTGSGGFDAWAEQIPDATQRGRGDDFDGDGFTNGQEYLFGTSPISGNGSLFTSSSSGGSLVLTWLQLETGGSYALKENLSLNPLTWVNSAVIPVLGNQTGVPTGYDRFTATLPINADRKFFRIDGAEN